jgi:hypothetical protein
VIAVLRAELYRTVTIRSSWVAVAVAIALGVVFDWFSPEFWTLFAGLGSFGVAVMSASQHYQHRTSVLLFLGQPRRLLVLAAQCLCAMLVSLLIAGVSGLVIIQGGDVARFRSTMAVVPLMAIFGVANATIVRRPLWLFAGYAGWLLFAEGLIGKLDSPLPFSSFLLTAAGDHRYLMAVLGWTAASVLAAVWSIRRDLTGD